MKTSERLEKARSNYCWNPNWYSRNPHHVDWASRSRTELVEAINEAIEKLKELGH